MNETNYKYIKILESKDTQLIPVELANKLEPKGNGVIRPVILSRMGFLIPWFFSNLSGKEESKKWHAEENTMYEVFNDNSGNLFLKETVDNITKTVGFSCTEIPTVIMELKKASGGTL